MPKLNLVKITLLLIALCISIACTAQTLVTIPIDGGTVTLDEDRLRGKDGVDGKDGVNGKDGITTVVYVNGASKLQGSTYNIYTAADVDSAMALMKLGKVSNLVFWNNIKKNIILPKYPPIESKRIGINLNTNNLTGWIHLEPCTWSELFNQQSGYKLDIYNGMITGSGADTLINCAGFYPITVTNISLRKANTGIYFNYNLNATAFSCDASGVKYPFVSDYPRNLAGATASTAASNQAKFIACRVHSGDSTAIGYINYAGSDNLAFWCTAEGTIIKTAFMQDDRGATTNKLQYYMGSHVEVPGTVFDFNASTTHYFISGLWLQKPNIVVRATGSPTINISGVPNWASPTFDVSSSTIMNFDMNKQFGLDSLGLPTMESFGAVKPTICSFDYTYQGRHNISDLKLYINGKKQ